MKEETVNQIINAWAAIVMLVGLWFFVDELFTITNADNVLFKNDVFEAFAWLVLFTMVAGNILRIKRT